MYLIEFLLAKRAAEVEILQSMGGHPDIRIGVVTENAGLASSVQFYCAWLDFIILLHAFKRRRKTAPEQTHGVHLWHVRLECQGTGTMV